MDVGLVGLGAMGRGMAASLRRGAHRVHVCDVRAEAAREFAAEGGVACANPAAAAHQMFMQASSAGHGREDDAAVIKIFPGIELPAKK